MGGVCQRVPTGIAADDKGINNDSGRRLVGHGACPHSRAYGHGSGAVAAGLQ